MKKSIFLITLLLLPLIMAQSETTKEMDNTCLMTAVVKREDSLFPVWEKFSAFVDTAHETRKSQLILAWNIENPVEMRKAVKAAWLKYKNDVKAARKIMESDRRLVWKTFRTEVMACKKQGATVSFWENEADDKILATNTRS